MLLHLDLVLISIASFSLSVASFVELDVCRFTEELDILDTHVSTNVGKDRLLTNKGFLLADHDGSFQMHVYDHKQFMITWLEEKLFHIAEENVCAEGG